MHLVCGRQCSRLCDSHSKPWSLSNEGADRNSDAAGALECRTNSGYNVLVGLVGIGRITVE
jgi:hypothetical protein